MPTMTNGHRSMTGGLVLIVIGLLFLISNFVPEFDFGKYWPLILIAVGIGMLINRRQFHHTEGEQQ